MKSHIHAYEAVFGRNVEARRFVNFLISGGVRKASNALWGGDTESSDSSYDSIKPDQDELDASFAEIETLLHEYKTKRQFDTIRRLADKLVEGFDGMWLDWIKKYKVGMGTSYGAPGIFSYIKNEHLTLPEDKNVMIKTLLEAQYQIFRFVSNVANPQQPNKHDYLPPPPKKYSLDVIQFAKQQIYNNPFNEEYTEHQKQHIDQLERNAEREKVGLPLKSLPPPNTQIKLQQAMTEALKLFVQSRNTSHSHKLFVEKCGGDALKELYWAFSELENSEFSTPSSTIPHIVERAMSMYNERRDKEILIPVLRNCLQKNIGVYNEPILSSLNDKTKQCLQQHKTNYYKQGEPSQESFEATVESMYNDCIKQNYPHVYTDHE